MGVPVTPAGRHRRHLGFLSQEPKFYRWMTGRQVMRYVARFFGTPDEAHIERLLGEAGIADAADRKTKTYSGGMRQRLGIAQALVGRPQAAHARRAGLLARSRRPGRSARHDAETERGDDDLFLDAHPRRRAALQRLRGDPGPRQTGHGGKNIRFAGQTQQGPPELSSSPGVPTMPPAAGAPRRHRGDFRRCTKATNGPTIS